MSRMTRSAHGLSTPVDGWWSRGACRSEDPELFFRESDRSEALHICRRHCPVLAECKADARALSPRHGVQAGEAWTANGTPQYGGALKAVSWCHRCLTERMT